MKSFALGTVLALALLGVAWVLQPVESVTQAPSVEQVVVTDVEIPTTSVERTDMEVVAKKRNKRLGFQFSESVAPEVEHAVFASGIVTDHEGNPLDSATVRLDSRKPSTNGVEGGEAQWTLGDVIVQTDEDGKFTMRAPIEEREYRLKIQRNRYLQKVVPCDPGIEFLEIRLDRPTTVRGKLILDEAFLDTYIVVHLTAPGAKDFFSGMSKVVREDGLFHLKNQPSGDLHLHISFLRERVLIHTIPVFLSQQGGTFDLGDIDLRGMARRIRIKVASGDDEPVRGAWAATPDGKILAQSISAPLEILTVEPRLDLLIGARQYRTMELRNAADHEEVVLHSGLPIPTQVHGFPRPATWKLLGYWEPLKPIAGWERAHADLFQFEADGNGLGRVSEPGEYRLHLLAMPMTQKVYYAPVEFGDATARGIFTAQTEGLPEAQVIDLNNAEITSLLDRMTTLEGKKD